MKKIFLLILFIFLFSCTQVNKQQEEQKQTTIEHIHDSTHEHNELNETKEEKPDTRAMQQPSESFIDEIKSKDNNVKEFKIEAFQFGFDPNTIEVNQGDKVRFIAWSRDVPHGLTIREFEVKMNLQDSNPQTVEFVADKKGTFTFFCSVPCGANHKEMKGRLIVK